MIIHATFFIFYLILLAYNADRFHRQLKIISVREKALKKPGAIKEKIWAELDLQRAKLKRVKTWCIYRFFILAAMHELSVLIIPFVTKYYWNLPSNHLWYPLPSLIISLFLLVVIFWLKGSSTGLTTGELDGRGPYTMFR